MLDNRVARGHARGVWNRLAGLALVAAVVATAVAKVRAGIPGELWWTCHVCAAVLGVSAAAGGTRAADGAGLLLLAVGLPGWLLEVATHGPTGVASAVEHVLGPLVAVAGWRAGGIGPRAAVQALGWWLGTAAIAAVATDPALNVNLVVQPFDTWPAGTPNAVAFGATTALAAGLAAAAERAIAATLGRRVG